MNEPFSLPPAESAPPTLDLSGRVPQVALVVPEAIPVALGRYQIRRLLGRGGMGSVYLAHDPRLDRLVAIKVPRLGDGSGPRAVKRFLREARAAATLSHPNICAVHDADTAGGVPYLAMAYVEGRPLAELVRPGRPLPEPAVAAVVRKLARTMQAAHEKGVIHRDLKPANVMITPRHQPVIMDFGLARRRYRPGDSHQDLQGRIAGTPAYMPPEQIEAGVGAVGPAADVYSLGVILYELLAGRTPFVGPLAELLRQIVHDPVPPPSRFRPGLDPDLEAVCLRALAKRPQDRYRPMSAFADDLGGWLARAAARPAAPAVVLSAGPPPESPFADLAATPESSPDVQFAEIAAHVEDSPSGYARRPAARRTTAGLSRALVWWGVAGFALLMAVLAVVRLASDPAPYKKGPSLTPKAPARIAPK